MGGCESVRYEGGKVKVCRSSTHYCGEREERGRSGERNILTRASKTRSPTVSAFSAIMSNKALNVSARN